MSDYRCEKCGLTGVKLWRESGLFTTHLRCVICMTEGTNVRPHSIRSDGSRIDEVNRKTFQLGAWVPAVYTPERGGGYLPIGNLPTGEFTKWQRLPNFPEPVCSKCGGEDPDGYLFPITVTCNPGEEGYAEVTQLLCGACEVGVFQGLRALGFVSHNHHGTNPLDAEDCGGYGKCPNPAEYGPETIQPQETVDT